MHLTQSSTSGYCWRGLSPADINSRAVTKKKKKKEKERGSNEQVQISIDTDHIVISDILIILIL